MNQNPITRRAFALSSIALTALVLSSFATVSAAEAAAPTPPDLTAGGVMDKTHDWLLGPTGARGWMFFRHEDKTAASRQILVTAVEKGSPADGILLTNDVILGVEGKPFAADSRKSFAQGIAAAEARDGELRLIRWREGPYLLEVALNWSRQSSCARVPGFLGRV